MSFGGDEDAGVGFATARGRDWPSVRQFNIFVANRLGGLLNVVRRFETSDIRIIAMTVVDSTDGAIIRIMLSDPERAYEVFEQAKLAFTESDRGVGTLPDGQQPLETARTDGLSYSVFNLEAQLRIARLAAPLGIDVWNYTSPRGGSLKQALEYLKPFDAAPEKWPHHQLEKKEPGFLKPLLEMAAQLSPLPLPQSK